MDTCDPAQVFTTSHCQDQATPRLVVENLTFARRELRRRAVRRRGRRRDLRARRAPAHRALHVRRQPLRPRRARRRRRSRARAVSYHGLPVNVVNSRFTGNVCSNGGALSSIGVSWNVAHSTFIRNRAIGRGANPARGRHARAAAAAARSTTTATASRSRSPPPPGRQPRRRGRRGDLLRQQRPHRHARDRDSVLQHNPSDGFRDRRPARHLLPGRGPPAIVDSVLR